MSSRSKMVQIGRSMVILDPQTMPVNLGYSGREDYPEQAFPCLAYDGNNVLPTALGYQSYFAEHNRLNIGDSLKSYKVQAVFQYQSVNMRTLSIALCEDGIRIANGSEGPNSFEWQLAVDFSSSEIEEVRRLWTYCVISNKLYLYQQGQAKFYAVVNAAEYLETTIPATIVGASIEQVWYNEAVQTGIHAIKPNFINMEGQIGIFKAANRLGMWDSDGAVAWSSATQIYDFKPSTTTFAGITTFADVVGRIVMIKQHSTGFIIYATRSITLCSPITGSPEKWAGRALFSDVGVVFDTQVVVAQPDSIHYAITSGGLCRITSGNPEYIEPEAMDYIRNNNEVYSLSFLDSRYLMIHTTKKLNRVSLPTIIVEDLTGEPYEFPKPVIVDTSEFLEWLANQLASLNASQQAEFPEAQEPEEGMIPPKNGEALLPCWTGKGLVTNFDSTVLNRPQVDTTISITSPTQASTSWEIPVSYFRPLFTAYYWDAEEQFIDKAAEEFVEELTKSTYLLLTSSEIANEGVNKFGSIQIGALEAQTDLYQGSQSGIITTEVPVGSLNWYWRNVPLPLNFDNTSGNDCAILLEPSMHDVRFDVYATITERVTSGEAEAAQLLFGYSDESGIYEHVEPALITRSGGTILSYTPLNPVLNALLKDCYSTSYPSQLPEPYQDLYTFWVASEITSPLKDGAFSIAWSGGNEERSNQRKPKDYVTVLYLWSLGFRAGLAGGQLQGSEVSRFDNTTSAMAASVEQYCYSIGTYKTEDGPTPGTSLTSFGTSFPDFFAIEWGTSNLSPTQVAEVEALVGGTIELMQVGLRTEITYESLDKDKIFEAEISGYGYYPKGGFSFRKTHRRSIFKPCAPTGLTDYTFKPEDLDKLPTLSPNKGLPGVPTLNPPFSWDYPETLPLLPNYVLFQEGTLAPYYPTYEEAVVWDTQYNKWGRYNNPHKAVYSLFPVNRTDQSIVPNQAGILRGGALSPEGWCSVFSTENPTSRITYGKIGDYRLGWTKATKAVAQFGYPANAYVVAEVSMDGDTVDTNLSQAGNAANVRRLELPFTLEGKWFNIRFEGQFNIVGLSLESQARSRR